MFLVTVIFGAAVVGYFLTMEFLVTWMGPANVRKIENSINPSVRDQNEFERDPANQANQNER